MVTKVLEQYSLPSLVNLITSDIGKERWKILCKKAVGSYWARLFLGDKNKVNTEVSINARTAYRSLG